MKYNLSKIMKRAWFEFKKYDGDIPFSKCLKEAWRIAKKEAILSSFFKEVKVVVGGKILTVDISDGTVTGNTFPVKKELNKKWGLRWDPEAHAWTGTDYQLRELCYYCEYK